MLTGAILDGEVVVDLNFVSMLFIVPKPFVINKVEFYNPES
jgi:hypothetical protein